MFPELTKGRAESFADSALCISANHRCTATERETRPLRHDELQQIGNALGDEPNVTKLIRLSSRLIEAQVEIRFLKMEITDFSTPFGRSK